MKSNISPRDLLKLDLFSSRREYSALESMYLTCPICMDKISRSSGNIDMHEALLPRSAVQGSPDDVQALIMHRCNVVLVHHGCHVPGSGGEEIWKSCLDHLIKWEGVNHVEDYLVMMSDKLKINGKHALDRFYGYYPKEEISW